MRVSRFGSLVASAAIGMVVSVTLAHASSIGAGTMEVSPSISFGRSSVNPVGGGDAINLTHYNASVGAGRAINSQFEIIGGALMQRRNPKSGDGVTAWGGSVGAQYHFASQGSVIPFLSAGIGAVQFDSNGETDRAMLLPMMRVGIRSMMGDSRSVNFSIGYQRESNPNSAVEDNANMFDRGVGMSFLSPGH